MVGLRNLLIHEYGIIEIDKLWKYLNYLDDISAFIYAIQDVNLNDSTNE